MNILINACVESRQNGFLDSVSNRLTATLSRFASRISRANVTLIDVNGPRGGVDKQCRVSVVMPRSGQVAASAQHADSLAAVSQAAERVRRMVVTKLKRPKALQVRRRKSRFEPTESQGADVSKL